MISRRRLLSNSTIAVAATTSGCAVSSSQTRSGATSVFAHGIASGDPLADRVILWTRVEASKDALVHAIVAKKADVELRKIMGTPLATLDLQASVKAWGVISFLMDTRRDKFIDFLKRLKERKDPATEPQEDVFQAVFGTSIEAIDTEWRAFALRAY